MVYVNKGYGLINCNNRDNDTFIHYSNIAKNNPNKFIMSLAQGEVLQFDV